MKYADVLSVINEDMGNGQHKYDSYILSKILEYIVDENNLDVAINMMLKTVGEYYGVSRSYIFEVSIDKKTFSNTFEWCAKDISSEIENLQNIPNDGAVYRMYLDSMDENGVICCSDINMMMEEPRESLARQGIKAILLQMFSDNGEFAGMIGYDDCVSNREWTQEQVGTLSLISKLIGLALSKRRAKETSKQLSIQDEIYRIAITYSNSLVFRIDLKTHTLYIPEEVTENNNILFSFDKLPDSAIAAGYIAEESIEDYRRFISDIISGVEGSVIELKRRYRDDSYHWLRGRYTIIHSDEGTPVSAIVSYINIDAEKQKETEVAFAKRDRDMLLASAGTRFQLCIFCNLTQNRYHVYEHNQFGIMKTGEDGVYDELVIHGSSGIPNEESEDFRELFCCKNLLKAYHEGKKDVFLIHRQEGIDGKTHWIRTTAVFVENSIDDDIFAIILVDNVDNMKLAEMELQKREILLQKSLDAEQKANNAKSEFLSNMSHDLRTPLNSIINLTYLARNRSNDRETLDDYLDKIGIAGQFMLGLINDILDMSRIERGSCELHEEVYYFSEFEKYIDSVIGTQCRSKKIEFVWNITDPHVSIITDKIRFNQIFFNILSNSVKYTDEGGRIEVFAGGYNDGDHEHINFVITDTGCGMSEEFQKKLFTPFEREDFSRVTTGTGLGLPIAKKLIEKMGGSINIESKKGIGTKVSIRLCCRYEEEKDTEEGSPAVDSDGMDIGERLRGKRILVVEDHPMNQAIACFLLEEKGCLTECANNGQEAVDKLSNCEDGYYSAILMDVRMPVIDGLTAAKRIKQLDREYTRRVPIIAMTANAFEDDADGCYKAGMQAFLPKPINPDEMYATIARQIGKDKKV